MKGFHSLQQSPPITPLLLGPHLVSLRPMPSHRLPLDFRLANRVQKLLMQRLRDSLSRHPSQSNTRRVSRLDRHYLKPPVHLLPGLVLETLHLSNRQVTPRSRLVLLQAQGHLDLHLPVPRSVHSRWHLLLCPFPLQDLQVPHHNNLRLIRSGSVRAPGNPRPLLSSRASRLTMGERLRRRRDNLEHPHPRCRRRAVVVVPFSRWVPHRRRQRHYLGNAQSGSYQRAEMPTLGDERHLPRMNAPGVFCAITMNAFFLYVFFYSINFQTHESYVGSHFHGTYFLELMGSMVSSHQVSYHLSNLTAPEPEQ